MKTIFYHHGKKIKDEDDKAELSLGQKIFIDEIRYMVIIIQDDMIDNVRRVELNKDHY